VWRRVRKWAIETGIECAPGLRLQAHESGVSAIHHENLFAAVTGWREIVERLERPVVVVSLVAVILVAGVQSVLCRAVSNLNAKGCGCHGRGMRSARAENGRGLPHMAAGWSISSRGFFDEKFCLWWGRLRDQRLCQPFRPASPIQGGESSVARGAYGASLAAAGEARSADQDALAA